MHCLFRSQLFPVLSVVCLAGNVVDQGFNDFGIRFFSLRSFDCPFLIRSSPCDTWNFFLLFAFLLLPCSSQHPHKQPVASFCPRWRPLVCVSMILFFAQISIVFNQYFWLLLTLKYCLFFTILYSFDIWEFFAVVETMLSVRAASLFVCPPLFDPKRRHFLCSIDKFEFKQSIFDQINWLNWLLICLTFSPSFSFLFLVVFDVALSSFRSTQPRIFFLLHDSRLSW